ncbi:unnamed protein product [Trifolium pratense]|uniref:Uncharacterized protein n=1 Tax=Trifolium pratense TaxID=57577 RepID=A0ACB0IXY2_TRIPR|nr:unnamed protein product [Trifolium pratense]
MGQSKISLKELASVRRKTPESIDDYLNRFRLLKARCFTQVSEHELVEMAAGGLDYSIRKKLDTQHLRDMAQLADRVRQVERLKAEKARSSKHQRQQRLSLQEAQKTEDNKGKQVVEVTRRPLKERLTQPGDDRKVENEFEGENMEDEDLLDSDPEFDVLVNVVSILPAEYDVWSEVTEGEDEFDESELALHKPMCYYDQQEAFDAIKKYLSNPPTLMPPIRNKFMKLYISASDTTLGSMLAQEDENGEEKAIYYLSRVLNDVETRYSSIEKLCLCLYFSCMKLKHYIKPIDVYVYSHYDVVKHMLLKPILHSRIGRWALALSEYSLSYKPLKAIKGQIVADFIVDHSAIESPQNYIALEPWTLYFDGSRHQHGTRIGILIISPQKIPTKFKYRINGICSNNEAEYEALIAGLEILLSLGAKDIKIKGDSELVLKQLTKEYKCIKEHLIRYFVIANALLKRFDSIDIEHVPRIENQEANDLAQIASGYKVSKEKLEQLIEIKEKLISNEPMQLELSMPKLEGAEMSPNDINNSDKEMNYDEFQIFVIDNLIDGDWRKPIVEYLENPIGSAPRKIKYRASNYVIIGNELFKKTLEGVLLKCLSENEAYIAISDVHSGACGSHQSGHKMKWLLVRQGMYWPSMLKDCIDFAKGCQECQKHAGIQHVPASELHSIIKPWPFRGWALDLIGEIKPASSKNQKYIIVGVDYFTKWIEAIPLPNVDQEEVISFIQNHIIYRFGIPETITTDQDSVFTGRKMQEFARQTGFKLLTSTPYYAQANGQVEAANKIIIGLIRKHIAQKPRNWNKTLNQVLWACRNSPKESTNSTPFRLTYGHDAVLPVEIYLQSIRIQRQMEIPTDHYWSMMFDELVDLDEERLRALDALSRQKERVAKAYNKKVKSKTFEVGNLVWKVILPTKKIEF